MIITVGNDVDVLKSRLQQRAKSQDRLIPGARIDAEGFPMSSAPRIDFESEASPQMPIQLTLICLLVCWTLKHIMAMSA